MNPSPLLGRILYALLVGVVIFVVLLAIGNILGITVLATYAGLIGLLAGLVAFFTGRTF